MCNRKKREYNYRAPPSQISKSVLYNIDWIIQYVYAALLANASSAALTQNNTFCDIIHVFHEQWFHIYFLNLLQVQVFNRG